MSAHSNSLTGVSNYEYKQTIFALRLFHPSAWRQNATSERNIIKTNVQDVWGSPNYSIVPLA